MPYSGKGTDAEIDQRSLAGQKHSTHGTYAFQHRGPDALQPAQRGKYAELQELLSTRPGAIDALKEQAIQTMMLAFIAQSYVVEQKNSGKSLDDIALLRCLPGFWNSANRCLKAYLDVLPREENVLDLGEAISKAVKEHEQNKE
jgi:hypothetical protein